MKNPFKKTKVEVDEYGDERGEGQPLSPAMKEILSKYDMKEGDDGGR